MERSLQRRVGRFFFLCIFSPWADLSFLVFCPCASVADPSDPYVFGPYGSGSGSFYHQEKMGKNLDFYCFVTSFDFFKLVFLAS